MTIAVYLSGASRSAVSGRLTKLLRHYRVVAEDVLGPLHEEGVLTRGAMGWYRLARGEAGP